MADTLTLTRTYSGAKLTLEIDRIRHVDEVPDGPGTLGILRRWDMPHRDFPVALVQYDKPGQGTAPGTLATYYVVQSADEIRKAIATGGGDLNQAGAHRARLKAYLQDLQAAGFAEVGVYTPIGTSAAEQGTWEQGPVEDRAIVRLIANLDAGHPLAAETDTLDDLRASQGRVGNKLTVQSPRE